MKQQLLRLTCEELDALHGDLVRCGKDHGGPGNSAHVYGHHGSVRTCIRLYGTDTWIFDRRWEARQT